MTIKASQLFTNKKFIKFYVPTINNYLPILSLYPGQSLMLLNQFNTIQINNYNLYFIYLNVLIHIMNNGPVIWVQHQELTFSVDFLYLLYQSFYSNYYLYIHSVTIDDQFNHLDTVFTEIVMKNIHFYYTEDDLHLIHTLESMKVPSYMDTELQTQIHKELQISNTAGVPLLLIEGLGANSDYFVHSKQIFDSNTQHRISQLLDKTIVRLSCVALISCTVWSLYEHNSEEYSSKSHRGKYVKYCTPSGNTHIAYCFSNSHVKSNTTDKEYQCSIRAGKVVSFTLKLVVY